MSLLPFGELPVYGSRRFVPAQLDFGDWSQVEPLFEVLEQRATHLSDAADVERWLLDWGELRAALEQEATQRYIAMTCHTESLEAEKAYLDFVDNMEPQIKDRQFKLEQHYLSVPLRSQLPPTRYAVFDRNTRQRVELFRPESLPLETKETKLGQQYQKLCGALTVSFRGEEQTLVQMSRYQEEPNRPLRQETWELVVNRRIKEAEQFEGIFDEMVQLREQIARNAGFRNYLEYAFRARGRFDYAPDDCLRFHEAIEQEVLPLLRELQADRRQKLNLAALRPWDLAVDPSGRPPLRPFTHSNQMVAGTQRIFERLDRALADQFQQMHARQLLDLDNRKGKAPGGYQSTLPESRLPFIFMNAVGIQRDIETLLHEAGHAFHVFATQNEDFFPYREAPIEFCEVASMSMELLGNEYVEVFYGPEESRRARRDHLEGIVEVFPWIATVDAFQHWLYTHPHHSREERKAAWRGLMQRFGGEVDWAGYDEIRDHLWHRQLHIFLHPFYYVEYGIAQLGALQVWANAKQDKAGALRAYKRALSLGGARPLPALFGAAECRLGFDARTIRPLMQLVRMEINKRG